MQVLVRPDSTVAAQRGLSRRVECRFDAVLSHYGPRLAEVEVELTDASAERATGNDVGCLARGRLDGEIPVAVVHHASTLEEAVGGAVRQLDRLLDSLIGCTPKGSDREWASTG